MIVLVLKLEQTIDLSWRILFFPIYILEGLVALSLCLGGCFMLVMVLDDALIKIGTFLLTLASLCLTVFFVLLSAKIGEEESDIQQWRWFAVFSPLWAMHLLLIISGIVFLAVFPDESFVSDDLTRGQDTRMKLPSIKPRYRINFFLLITALLNLPLTAFDIMLCLYLDYNLFAQVYVFLPLFLVLAAGLGVIIALTNAHKQRGTYCIRIDKGVGARSEEIW
jgi:hypothetical protein